MIELQSEQPLAPVHNTAENAASVDYFLSYAGQEYASSTNVLGVSSQSVNSRVSQIVKRPENWRQSSL